MSSTFAQLGVPEFIFKSLEQRGIVNPFEIQLATISDALAGRDVCGGAPTGSGKTIAYGIPLVAKVQRSKSKAPRALILAPTRELAEQIGTEIRTFSGKARVGIVYGGVGYQGQSRMLRDGVEILVACPGRLEDLISQRLVGLSSVEHIVLDEADRMADMGFMPAVRRILGQTAAKRQTMLFSATLDGDVAKLTKDHQKNPVHYKIGQDSPDGTPATHLFWKVRREDRVSVAAGAVDAVWPAIVFCRTRGGSDRLAKNLLKLGLQVVVIHGGRTQNQRTRALSDFTNKKVQALIASDVAARGLDIQDVASVIHFDPPDDHKAYIHRSGRTARAGKGGVVLSLVQSDQIGAMRQIQRQVGLNEGFADPSMAKLHSIARSQSSVSSSYVRSKRRTVQHVGTENLAEEHVDRPNDKRHNMGKIKYSGALKSFKAKRNRSGLPLRKLTAYGTNKNKHGNRSR